MDIEFCLLVEWKSISYELLRSTQCQDLVKGINATSVWFFGLFSLSVSVSLSVQSHLIIWLEFFGLSTQKQKSPDLIVFVWWNAATSFDRSQLQLLFPFLQNTLPSTLSTVAPLLLSFTLGTVFATTPPLSHTHPPMKWFLLVKKQLINQAWRAWVVEENLESGFDQSGSSTLWVWRSFAGQIFFLKELPKKAANLDQQYTKKFEFLL